MKVIGVFGLLILSACASTQPVGGMLYSDVAGPVAATSQPMGAKHGTACATSFFGLVGLGDASISTAAKAGGISIISHVEQHSTNIIGYMKYCTDVWGHAGRPTAGAPTTPSAPPAPAAPTKPSTLNSAPGGVQTADNIE